MIRHWKVASRLRSSALIQRRATTTRLHLQQTTILRSSPFPSSSRVAAGTLSGENPLVSSKKKPTIPCRLYGTTRPVNQGSSSSFSPSLYWRTNLPHIFTTAQQDEDDLETKVWSAEEWKRAETVYRIGRSELKPNAINVENVTDGIRVLDCMVEERRKEKGLFAIDRNIAKRQGVVLYDPWLIRAWRDVAIAESERNNTHDDDEASLFSHQAMVQRLDQYLETEILAWDSHMLTWIIDVWQASHKPKATKLLHLVAEVTQDYSVHRPIDKFHVTRILNILSPKRQFPQQCTELVKRLQQLAELYPDDPNLQLDRHIYSAWVNVWADSKRSDAGLQALQILRLAQQNNVTGMALYNTVLNALCSSHDAAAIEQAHILWQEILDLGLSAVTAQTWTPLLRAHLEREEWRPAAQLWRSLKDHPKDNLRPHRVAREGLERVLRLHVKYWQKFFPDEDFASYDFPHPVDWCTISQEWEGVARELRKRPSWVNLAQALLLLDHVSFAAVVDPPSWVIPSADMDKMVTIQRRLQKKRGYSHEEEISLNAFLIRLRKYQGIGLLRPGSITLDWMMDGVQKISESPINAAVAAQTFLDETVEDCRNDVHHPDFINKVPLTRLIRLWADTLKSPDAAEVVWERMLNWYVESGGKQHLEPDDEVYSALVGAWNSSTTPSVEDKARRVWQLWQARLEQLKGTPQRPGIGLYHQVATAMAEAGRVEETETLATEIHEAYANGKLKLRKDLDFVVLRTLALCRASRSLEAFRLLQGMEKQCRVHESFVSSPSSLCYDILLIGFAQQGEFGKAREVLEYVVDQNLGDKKRKIHLSESSWKTLLNILADTESSDAANQALDLMEKSGSMEKHLGEAVAADLFMYNCVLKCLLNNPNPRQLVRKAESIMKILEKKGSKVKPDTVSYELFLGILVKAVLPGKASKYLEHFIRLSLQKAVKASPNTLHFRTVIHGFLELGSERSVETAVQMVRIMQGLEKKTDWDVRPSKELYRRILRCCREAKVAPALAEEVVKLMETQGSKPDAEMYIDIISCWAETDSEEAGQRVLELMEDISREDMQDVALYRRLVKSLGRLGLTKSLRVLAERMANSPKHCVASLEAFVDCNEFEDAVEMTGRIETSGGEYALRAITVWKMSKEAGAGAQSERLLQHMLGTGELESRIGASVFADVIWSYIHSEDSRMAEAADRLLDRCRDFLGSDSSNLGLLEAAIVAQIDRVHDGSFDRVCGLLDTMQFVVNSENVDTEDAMTSSSRLEASIEKSSIEQKDLLIQKLRQIITDRVHDQNNATTVL